MIFVPLSLIATLFLAIALIWFIRNRDMSLRPHRFFAALISAYCAQSGLLSLRWGYDMVALNLPIAVLAPVLPFLAWLAYRSLSGQGTASGWMPALAVGLCWLVVLTNRDLADLAILATFIGFGTLLLVQARNGETGLALSPVLEVRSILGAMYLTGAALILSGLLDVFVIYDFIRNQGENVGLAVSLAQTGFVLVIGVAAAFGRTSVAPADDNLPLAEPEADAEDAEILERLETLFENHLQRDEDLSLRKLARRLGVPDRRVSNAINRARGVNVSQYVNEFRIKDACDLLVSTDQSILQISMAAGFASKSNFNREFHRVTGQTPSEWRKKQRAARSGETALDHAGRK